MTYHGCSQGRARGHTKPGGPKSPRLAVSYPAVDFALATRLAQKWDKPVAQIMRDALWAYLAPVRDNPTFWAEGSPRSNTGILKGRRRKR